MTSESFFLDIAKIAITIAGFGGVIAALRHPRDQGWEANEVAGLKLILEHSFAAVASGLLPSVLYLYFSDEPEVWLVSSSLLALFLAFELLINIVRLRHATALGSPHRKFGLLLSTFLVPTTVFLFFQILNVFYWRGPVTFAAGAVWLIVAACFQFFIFVLHIRPKEKA